MYYLDKLKHITFCISSQFSFGFERIERPLVKLDGGAE